MRSDRRGLSRVSELTSATALVQDRLTLNAIRQVAEHTTFVLPDLLAPNLVLVVCGTGAGKRSALRQQYYAGRGNRFWQILSDTGLTPRLLAPAEYRQLLTYGIGLTDLVKHASGGDHQLRFLATDRDALEKRILQWRPRVLCFNGKRAAKEYLGFREVEYGLQKALIGDTEVFVAPSTSGAANASWDAEQWKVLAHRVRMLVRSGVDG